MAYYILLLQQLRIYPIYPDEKQELQQLFGDFKIDDLRITTLQSISIILFNTYQWQQCINICNIILQQIKQHKHSLDLISKCFQNINSSNIIQNTISVKSNKLNSKSSELYEIHQIPFKGYGLIATQNIPAYTLIIHEKPMLEINNNDLIDKQCIFQQFKQLSFTQQNIINNLSHSIAFNHEKEINSDKLLDIIEKNNIELIEEKLNGLFPTIARINHSCIPNVMWIGDTCVKKLKVISITDIKRGEELCAMYCHHGYLRVLRRKYLLQNFGFYCYCKRCNIVKEKDVIFDDKLNQMYGKVMHKMNRYLKEKNVNKLQKWNKLADEFFPDRKYFFEFVLENVVNGTKVTDVNSLEFKQGLTNYLNKKIKLYSNNIK
eukprot:362181_1